MQLLYAKELKAKEKGLSKFQDHRWHQLLDLLPQKRSKIQPRQLLPRSDGKAKIGLLSYIHHMILSSHSDLYAFVIALLRGDDFIINSKHGNVQLVTFA